MMNYNEMINRVKAMTNEELETAQFYNEMVERWNHFNYEWNRVILEEMRTRENK